MLFVALNQKETPKADAVLKVVAKLDGKVIDVPLEPSKVAAFPKYPEVNETPEPFTVPSKEVPVQESTPLLCN